jgi:hypothetical protein
MIILCTSRINSKESAFCPHGVLMGFRMVRTANHLFFLYSIHLLVCLMEVNCVLGEVRNEPLITDYPYTVSRSRAMAQAISRRPFITESRVRSYVSPCEI